MADGYSDGGAEGQHQHQRKKYPDQLGSIQIRK
jgi:hypothetical protein